MSRRYVAPALLLLAAALSLAAVFAVHRIEARGGPLSQPSATTYFSPNDDGVQDTAEVRFTTRQPEVVTVDVVDARDELVVRLAKDERVDGETRFEWDGRDGDGELVPEGPYRIWITRGGDDRVYAPIADTVVDVTRPVGVLDRATLELGELRGLAFLAEGETLEVFRRGEDEPVLGGRQFRPAPGAEGAQPEQATPPADAFAVRFTVSLDGAPERIDVVDLAGNRRVVFPDPGGNVIFRANG